jgi:hypothetical protein
MRRLLVLLPLVAGAVALTLLFSRSPHAAQGAKPSTIARGLPGGAVVYLEAEQLRHALELWDGSTLRKRWSGSAADKEMQKSMLFLRLRERLAGLEQIAGFDLTMARLEAIAGDHAGLAVYDLGATTFVFEAQLSSAQLAETPLAKAKQRFASRKYAGVDYFVQSAKRGSQDSELAFAILAGKTGGRLVVSNDVAKFHDALLLAAKEEGVSTDGTKAAASLASDARFTELMAAAPHDAVVRVYVALDAIRGKHHFDDFWVFGGDSEALDGIDASLLSLGFAGGDLTETRVHYYGDPKAEPAAAKVVDLAGTNGRGEVGGVDVTRVASALPAVGMASSVEAADAEHVSAKLDALLPQLSLDAGEPSAHAPPSPDKAVADVLAHAEMIDRVLEVIDVERVAPIVSGRPAVPVAHRHGAIVFAIKKPHEWRQPELEKAILDYLWAAAGDDAHTIAFADADRGTRKVVMPLVDEWSLTIGQADGGRLIVIATDPTLAVKIMDELGRSDGPATLLDEKAPIVARVDLGRAADAWNGMAAIIAPRQNWTRTDDAAWVGTTVPSLLAAVSGIGEITTVGYRTDNDKLYVEQVSYR